MQKAWIKIIALAATAVLLTVSCSQQDISDNTQPSATADITSPQQDSESPTQEALISPVEPTTQAPIQKPGPTKSPATQAPEKPTQSVTNPPQTSESGSIDKSTYTTVTKDNSQVHIGTLILVNNKIKYTFPENKDLVSVYENKNSTYKVRDTVLQLSSILMDDLNEMLSDFRSAKNIRDMIVVSGYRTHDYQQGLFDKEVKEVGAAEAAFWVASPGGSEHHTGYALDFSRYDDEGNSYSYTGEGDYAWINSNCYKYGFVVRYATDKVDLTGIKYEPWHFRYVGQPHAGIIVEKGFCYEEYIDYIKEYKFGEKHLCSSDTSGKEYEIYFVPASSGASTEISVPKDKSYTISGNNVDGFIVTAER